MRRVLISCLLSILLGAHCLANIAAAAVFSQVTSHGELYDPTTETVGGSDVGTAQIGTPDDPKTGSGALDFGGTRSISSAILASAESGRLAFDISSSIVVTAATPSARLSAFVVSINNRVIDQFSIGPGVGPGGVLNNGDPAQVLLQVRLDGEIQQQGRPSGALQFAFQLRGGEGGNLPLLVDFNTGGLNPPQSFEIQEEHDLLVDVTVGSTLDIDALMSGWINGTAFDPGENGTNFIAVDTIARVSNAPGYELIITSEAGAPTTPIPVVAQFNDVPPDYWSFPFIEILADSRITAGCGNENFCPTAPVTRAQMAVFLVRGMWGSDFSPPVANGNVFLDVSVGSFAASFIEQFFLDGITAGCGNNNYCPEAEVTRDQMAVFLLRAKHGAGYSPPPATGVFDDVPLSHWAVHWIEQLAAEGITAGCGSNKYCPDATVNRDQMAVFLVRAFGL